MTLRLLSLTEDNWESYCSWAETRPPMPRQMILVADDVSLLLGACVYMSEGPYMILEHLRIMPGTTPHMSHKATVFAGHAALGLATMENKIAIIFSSLKGVQKTLQRVGFTASDTVLLQAYPGTTGQNVPQLSDPGGDQAPGVFTKDDPEGPTSKVREPDEPVKPKKRARARAKKP